MLCLPQVYELFLKNMVGGLHTVYTKLKRLEITPIICNVEQVRALRSKNAIQPGVNRCKLIAATDFDRLYDDCTNTWSLASPLNPMILGQFLPQLNAQQLLLQHMMVLCSFSGSSNLVMSAGAEVDGTPLNLSKTTSNSETSDSDSLENMRKGCDISPNQSICERGGSNDSDDSPSSVQSIAAATKIITLIDMASDHFKQQMESIRKERGDTESLRCRRRICSWIYCHFPLTSLIRLKVVVTTKKTS
ncbi:unnamed protein product [Angiostrongylus costaricensis]|uniref:Ski_Sno domain-containing protein n=1 Tax=Angiostrongylus costaricensis TaxID=334426 RepID=A0A0R3PCV6_ANGCS|nr:unnamed protein product [Angiostrongylus costaricensis]